MLLLFQNISALNFVDYKNNDENEDFLIASIKNTENKTMHNFLKQTITYPVPESFSHLPWWGYHHYRIYELGNLAYNAVFMF